MSNEKGKDRKKGGKIALAICIVVIVALCILVYFLLHRDDKVHRDVVVNEENVDEILSEMEGGVDPGSYQATMNSTWHFEKGDVASYDAYVENTEANKNPVYFDITRSDTNETIFESPIIPVGSHLDKIILNNDMSQGTYDCVMTYHLLDEDEETISTVRVSLKIVIEH